MQEKFFLVVFDSNEMTTEVVEADSQEEAEERIAKINSGEYTNVTQVIRGVAMEMYQTTMSVVVYKLRDPRRR